MAVKVKSGLDPLPRARPVAGPDDARRAVEAVVFDVLNQPRDPLLLAGDVVEMRQKMLDHMASRSDAIINLKYNAGGLVDIEFIAQYARLAYGGCGRQVSDMLRSLPDVWREQADFLGSTYREYHQMENALRVELWRSIGTLPNDASATEWKSMRRHAAIQSPEALRLRMRRVHAVFNRILMNA